MTLANLNDHPAIRTACPLDMGAVAEGAEHGFLNSLGRPLSPWF
jgi:hypothetical protein